jgi:hypothetical protein
VTGDRCDNEAHPRAVKAVARLSWPDGRFITVNACRGCVRWSVNNALFDGSERRPILVSPLLAPEVPQ